MKREESKFDDSEVKWTKDEGRKTNDERQIQYSTVLYFEFYIGPDT